MLLLSFYANLKNDHAEKVNPLQMLTNLWYSGALQEGCRDTQKVFTTWSEHVALIWCCVLPAPCLGQCLGQVGFSPIICIGECKNMLVFPVAQPNQTAHTAPPLLDPLPKYRWRMVLHRTWKHITFIDTQLSTSSHALLFRCLMDSVVSSHVSGLFNTWKCYPKWLDSREVKPQNERQGQQWWSTSSKPRKFGEWISRIINECLWNV